MSDIEHPINLRSPWLIAFWIVAALCAGLTLSSPATTGEESFDVFLRLVVVLPAALVIVRLPFVRVSLTPREMVNHGLFRNRTVSWSEVDDVRLRPTHLAVIPVGACAPVVRLHDGGQVELIHLAAYNQTPSPEARIWRQWQTLERHARGTSGLQEGR